MLLTHSIVLCISGLEEIFNRKGKSPDAGACGALLGSQIEVLHKREFILRTSGGSQSNYRKVHSCCQIDYTLADKSGMRKVKIRPTFGVGRIFVII